ncbi:MAG: hypothetical protein OXE17_00915 [Chloroflexi bacterium]|nr:hypothetical protein [Chloroflexota bacterium]
MKQDQDNAGSGAGNSRVGRRFLENVRDRVDSVNQELQSNETLSQARETVRQGLENAAGAASEQATELAEGVQRTGDVLTGADLRKFDEFTEAVTRVCVGLHRDNVELRGQIARLEQQLEESGLAQKDLAVRLEALEEGND